MKQKICAHESRVTSVKYSPNGRLVGSCSFNGVIHLFDMCGEISSAEIKVYGIEENTVLQTLKGHTGYITGAHFTSD